MEYLSFVFQQYQSFLMYYFPGTHAHTWKCLQKFISVKAWSPSCKMWSSMSGENIKWVKHTCIFFFFADSLLVMNAFILEWNVVHPYHSVYFTLFAINSCYITSTLIYVFLEILRRVLPLIYFPSWWFSRVCTSDLLS